MSLFPFRQISEFPTGAALLNAEVNAYDFKIAWTLQRSRHCRLVYVTYRKVSASIFIRRKLGGTAVYYRPFAHLREGTFLLPSHNMCGLQIKGFILIKEGF